MIKGLIFDLDGTLADSIDGIKIAINLTARKYGYTEKSYQDVKMCIGLGARRLIKDVFKLESEEKIDEMLAYYNSKYDVTHLYVEDFYPNMRCALEALVKRGYKLAVLSNKPEGQTKGIIKKLTGERGIFSVVMGGNDSKPLKPSPVVPCEIASAFSLDPTECAFVGDSEVDVMTGKNSGMMTVACSWGYCKRLEALAELGADIIIDDASKLLDIFPLL